ALGLLGVRGSGGLALLVDQGGRFRLFLAYALGRLLLDSRWATGSWGRGALMLSLAALRVAVKLLLREVAECLRDRVLTLRLGRRQAVAAAGIVAVHGRRERVDVRLGVGDARIGISRAVPA